MKYTQEQVLDILKLVTKDPQSILDKWSLKKDNEYLDSLENTIKKYENGTTYQSYE